MIRLCTRLVLLFTAALALHSCLPTSSPSKTTSFATPYYPLKVGNMWKYKYMMTGNDSSMLVRHCIAERKYSDYTEYDIIDSVRFYGETNVDVRTLRQRDSIVECIAEGWLINFAATAADPDPHHGYVQGVQAYMDLPFFRATDIVEIMYPAAAYDGMPFQRYARGVGLVESVTRGPRLLLQGAIIDSQTYGKP